MSDDDPGSNEPDGKSNLNEIVSVIEKARALALSGDHKFLIYLLDMAWLEATNLAEKKKL